MHFNGASDRDIETQLKVIGIDSRQKLFQAIPEAIRFPVYPLPKGATEIQLRSFFAQLRREMSSFEGVGTRAEERRSFSGAGAYRHYIPSCIDELSSDSSFTTAYTPYQAEASQGTLQALFEYQTLIGELLAMDVVNASHYDGGTAFAEAIRMAFYTVNQTNRKTLAVVGTPHPEIREITQFYCKSIGIRFEFLSKDEELSRLNLLISKDEVFAVAVISPDFLGTINEYEDISKVIHEAGGLLLVHTDPIFCGMFRPPGELGADIVSAEGQPLGIHLSFGGPYLGILACRNELVRKLPGRLCGETLDHEGRRGFVLTLSTREQHIRRERATSNICTNQGLMALRAGMYLSWMGSQGLRRIAELCFNRAVYLSQLLQNISGIELITQGAFFREFCIRFPSEIIVEPFLQELAAHGFDGGVALSRFDPENTRDLLVAVTELNDREALDAFAEVVEFMLTTELGGRKQ